MRKFGLALILAILGFAPAQAQNVSWPPPAGTIAFLCVYNAVAPTMTTGSAGYAQCDVNGQIKTTGGGGVGGGAVTVADGADVTQGALADAAYTGSGNASTIAVLKGIYSSVNGIGTVKIDQTTPGTTNLVQESNWPATVDTNSGNKSASTPRFVLATDQPNLTTPLNTNPSGTLASGATFVSGTTAAMTVTTSTQVLAAVATKRLYVTRVKCNNSSGTATLVQIQDGSGGTVLDTLAAGATFGGEQGSGPTPLFWTTAGNGLFAQDVTTGASVICTASGYSG